MVVFWLVPVAYARCVRRPALTVIWTFCLVLQPTPPVVLPFCATQRSWLTVNSAEAACGACAIDVARTEKVAGLLTVNGAARVPVAEAVPVPVSAVAANVGAPMIEDRATVSPVLKLVPLTVVTVPGPPELGDSAIARAPRTLYAICFFLVLSVGSVTTRLRRPVVRPEPSTTVAVSTAPVRGDRGRGRAAAAGAGRVTELDRRGARVPGSRRTEAEGHRLACEGNGRGRAGAIRARTSRRRGRRWPPTGPRCC